MVNSVIMFDSEMVNDVLNMILSYSVNLWKFIVVSELLLIGKFLKLKIISWIIFKWLLLIRKNSVVSNIKSWLSSGVFCLLVGLIMEVKFKFDCILRIWLSMIKICIKNWVIMFIVILIIICLKVIMNFCSESKVILEGIVGIVGIIVKVSVNFK